MKKNALLIIAIGLSFTSLAFGDEESSAARARAKLIDTKPGQIEGLSHYSASALRCDQRGAKNVASVGSHRGSEGAESSSRAN